MAVAVVVEGSEGAAKGGGGSGLGAVKTDV